MLPASFTRYTTADYTGAGAIAGFGIDRGHLARSFDRTSASLDNAFTFYFSNIVPQAADLNQGPWAIIENYLGDLARLQNKEVYIIAGVAGNKGTVKNEGQDRDPGEHVEGRGDHAARSGTRRHARLPRPRGHRREHAERAGRAKRAWQTYQTTVDAVEALSGYDLLALLPDKHRERGRERHEAAARVRLTGRTPAAEGRSVAMSARGDRSIPTGTRHVLWSFGDGGTATGAARPTPTRRTASYTVRLTVTDNDAADRHAHVDRHRRQRGADDRAFAGATLLPGETYTATRIVHRSGRRPVDRDGRLRRRIGASAALR